MYEFDDIPWPVTHESGIKRYIVRFTTPHSDIEHMCPTLFKDECSAGEYAEKLITLGIADMFGKFEMFIHERAKLVDGEYIIYHVLECD